MKKSILFFFVFAFIFKTSETFAQVSSQDSLALVDLYNSTGGANWTAPWVLSTPVSGWFGIEVTGTRVTSINLIANNLIGTIPPSIGNLTMLQGLNLDANELTDTIPATIGNMSSLQYLYLINNQLTGSIPTTFGSLSNLIYLFLGSNDLSGTIPSSIDNLPALNYLYLDDNAFTFNGMETIANSYSLELYSPQADIILNNNSNILSTSAGGTLANDTFHWYLNNVLYQTIVGDSTLAATESGNYSVAVTNGIATQLTLYSDTIDVSTLPLKLLSFNATKEGNKNLLQWTTAQEINSKYFAVEKSNDNVSFASVGSITAKGDETSTNNYSFIDSKPNNGANYYRLRMVNKDGSFVYSGIKNINDAISFTATIYPDPVQTNLNLNFTSDETMNAQIQILNEEGKTMLSTQTQIGEGTSTQNITTSSLSNGVYYIRLITAQGESELKFVKAD